MRKKLGLLLPILIVTLATTCCTLAVAQTSALRIGRPRVAVRSSEQAVWPQSYYDGGHTGYDPNENTLSPSNVSKLHLLWSAHVPGALAALAEDYGTIFVQSVNLDQRVVFTALDAITGVTLWTTITEFSSPNNISTVAAADGLVFYVCQPSGSTQGVCANEARSGQPVWAFGPTGSEDMLYSPLDYANGVLYFSYCNINFYCDLAIGTIYGLDATSGNTKEVYIDPLDNPQTASFYNGLAVGGGYLYSSALAGGVFAVNSHGGVAWSYSHGKIVGAEDSVSVSEGVVYDNYTYDSTAGVVALDGTSGTPLWTFNYPYGYNSELPPAVANGVVYVTGYEKHNGAGLYALDAKTGKLLGSSDTDRITPGYLTSPSIANGVLYAGRSDGSTTAQDLRTGAILFETSGARPPRSNQYQPPPIVANGVLYTTYGACGTVCAYGLPAPHKR